MDGDLTPAFAAHAAALAAGNALGPSRLQTAFEQMGAVLYSAEAAAGGGPGFFRKAAGPAARWPQRHGQASSASDAEGRGRRRCRTLDTSLPLTPREHEIAGLAAGGLSNREIAERLVVSVRTVDNHLHSAFSKLGITHRSELAALLSFPVCARKRDLSTATLRTLRPNGVIVHCVDRDAAIVRLPEPYAVALRLRDARLEHEIADRLGIDPDTSQPCSGSPKPSSQDCSTPIGVRADPSARWWDAQPA